MSVTYSLELPSLEVCQALSRCFGHLSADQMKSVYTRRADILTSPFMPGVEMRVKRPADLRKGHLFLGNIIECIFVMKKSDSWFWCITTNGADPDCFDDDIPF